MALNPHHLELFHYVARFGGIAQASKRMPYGVGQPAISLQISRLEYDLGVTLFRRRPFKLTREGEKLAAHIAPFFQGLERIETELRGGAAPVLRVGATEMVQREHLPEVLAGLRAAHPGLRVAVRDGTPDVLTEQVRGGDLDLAVFMTVDDAPGDLCFTPLAAAVPALLVPVAHPAATAADILGGDRIAAPLVCLQPQEPVCVALRRHLESLGCIWEPALELGTQSLVNRYTLAGYGIGLGLAVPGRPAPEGLRELPLAGARCVTVGVLCGDHANPLRDTFIALATAHAHALCPTKPAGSAKSRGA